jgi:eukaryotic-like serine/threonine-protein kinase
VATSSDEEFLGTERFEVVRRIGAGGMGVVFQAFDRCRVRDVALKTLRQYDGAALYRLKREFRELADISHPNLVALHELISSADQWFFTMELVEGVDFITWVRGDQSLAEADSTRAAPLPVLMSAPRSTQMRPLAGSEAPHTPPESYDQLRDALSQLAVAVTVLHQARKLHRDIKPSNVLVEHGGRVVLLDFGLVTDVSPPDGLSSGYSFVGTVGYMSPEQSASRPLGPASDWYSVGTVLYEALTGTLPFVGSPIDVLMEKQRSEPEPPARLVAETPSDLEQLCCDLLRHDPDERPDGQEVLRRLGSHRTRVAAFGASLPGSDSREMPLVGRSAHVAALRDAFTTSRQRNRAVTVLVHGRSGMGKSILIERVGRELAAQHSAVVLAGRCHERESLPYKALDKMIDALSQHLARLPRREAEALMPRHIHAVARLFPVLRRVEAVISAPRQVVSSEPHDLRNLGLAALRELLARISDRRPLVLIIDDLQWSDLDSATLLLDLLRPPDAPALTLVLAYRTEELASSEALHTLVTGMSSQSAACDLREVAVGLLAPDEAHELAMARLKRVGDPSENLAAAIAREAGGDPFLIDQLMGFLEDDRRRPPGDIDFGQLLRSRLEQIDTDARSILELVAVAGQPVSEEIAARAAGLVHGDRLVPVLRTHSLIRTSGPPELRQIETYHDRIRESLLAGLSEERERQCHLQLAAALQTSDQPDPEILATHLLGGGATEHGARYAAEAAERAAAALAFERAAHFYRLAIDALPLEETSRRRLRAALAETLANAGRGAESAAAYLSAAKGVSPGESLQLRARAGEQLLRCGHVDEGLRVLATVLETVGLKAPARRWTIWSLLLQRCWMRLRSLRLVERDPDHVSAESLTRVDICWSVAVGLGVIDPIRGLEFQTRHLSLALAAGEPSRIARALAMEAVFSALSGRASLRRTEKLVGLARAIAERIDHPHARGLVAIARAMAEFQIGHWRGALSGFETAAGILRAHGTGVSEQTAIARFVVDSLFYLGDLGELCRRVPHYLAEAERRGDLYGSTEMRTGLCNLVWLVTDDPLTAQAECARGRDSSSRTLGFCLRQYYELLAETHIHLYLGDGEAAYNVVAKQWQALRKSMALRVQAIRAEALFLRGRAALAAAGAIATGGTRRERLLVEAERCRRKLDRETVPSCHAQADVLAAALARLRGDVQRSLQFLGQAESRLKASEMDFYVAAVRYRRGELTGGSIGKRLVSDAERWMRTQSVRNPAAMARIIC